jgi:hypothetical protein
MNSILDQVEKPLAASAKRLFMRPRLAKLLFFYTVPPLLMALPLGWNGAGLGAGLPFTASLILWAVVCLMSWWLSDFFSRVFAKLLRPWRPALWVILSVGYLVNLAASSVYNPAVVAALVRSGSADFSPMVVQYFRVDRNLLDVHYLALLFERGIPGMLIWLAGNYLFESITGITRFPRARRRAVLAHNFKDESRVAPADLNALKVETAMSKAPHIPRFFDRLIRLQGLSADQLVAVEAEDHYIQVHSTRGKELLYYRFGDALGDLQALQGVQIHRSTWVSRAGIARLEGSGRNLQVVLVTGDSLRVSHSNRGALRNAGWVS